jgi:hypothetical protein
VEEDRVWRFDPKGHVQRNGGDRSSALEAKAASRVNEDSHPLVTRPVESHPGSCASDAAIHLGDGNGSLRLPFDLVEKPAWDARREGEHAVRLAWQSSRNGRAFVPKRHTESK